MDEKRRRNEEDYGRGGLEKWWKTFCKRLWRKEKQLVSTWLAMQAAKAWVLLEDRMKDCHNHMIFITWISSAAEVRLGTGFNALPSSPSSHSQKCCFATSIICKWWFRVKCHFVREQWRSRLKRNRQRDSRFKTIRFVKAPDRRFAQHAVTPPILFRSDFNAC